MIVSDCDAPPVLEAAEQAFDAVTLAIGGMVERQQMLPSEPAGAREPILDCPLVGVGPPHDGLDRAMRVVQLRPERSRDRQNVV